MWVSCVASSCKQPALHNKGGLLSRVTERSKCGVKVWGGLQERLEQGLNSTPLVRSSSPSSLSGQNDWQDPDFHIQASDGPERKTDSALWTEGRGFTVIG